MACDLIAGLKLIEFFLCIVCLIYKLWTVWETLRVFYELEKQSREWPLSRRLALDRTGSIFSDIVLGSYVIITLGLLIGHAKGELARARTTEGFFLVLGTILFLIVGGVSITSVDDVPHKLVDNGIILGILTIVTAILFLLDIGFTRKQPGHIDSKTKKPLKLQQQKELPKRIEPKPTQVEKVDEEDKDKGKKKNVFQELKSSLKRRSHDGEANHRSSTNDVRTVEFQERGEFRENERQKRANDTTSPQVGRRNLENRGFSKRYNRDDGDDNDISSRRTVDPDEFQRSFSKVEKIQNGYIKNEDRQTAITMRDDERFYSRNGDDYRRRDEHLESARLSKDFYPEKRKDDHRPPNGYIRTDGKMSSDKEEFYQQNGYVRHADEVDSRKRIEMEESYRSKGYDRQIDVVDPRQRRHSVDYVDHDERISQIRSDDHLRRSKEFEKKRAMSVEGSPRFYRRDAAEDIFRKSQERYQFEDLRKPEYVEDRRSYKGYADTVKYLEETSSEKQRRHADDDSAMPPKHVIEVELDDHFYRPVEPKSKRSERKIEDRDTLQVAKVSSSQRSDNNNSSDDNELVPQIPSVSFLLSERGRKIMPSLSASPVERVERVSAPKYYFADPSSPGYVKQTASHWPSPSPVPPKEQ